MAAPFIPELSLGSVETGGGWGVGEQFARLPPAAVQAESRVQLYTVAAVPEGDRTRDLEDSLTENFSNSDGELTNNRSDTASVTRPSLNSVKSTECPAVSTVVVPTTHYATVSADDDDTFVDHGSSTHIGSQSPETATETSNGKSVIRKVAQQQVPDHLKLMRPVSRMSLTQAVRALVVAPDNASFFAAVDDDPVTLLDFKGVQLEVNRELDVTHVHAMAVVRVPAAKLVTFKTSSPKHRSNRSHSVVSAAVKPQPDHGVEGEESYVLWCGVSRGSIVIVDLSDYSVAGVLRNAHAQTITGVWFLSYGKVLTAGKDKALKVWDPQARRCSKSRNIATIISSVVYVSTRKQIWAISNDNYIRVFDSNGNNVRVHTQSNDKAENMVNMKGEMRFIQFYEPSDLIYVAMHRTLVIVDPGTCAVTGAVGVSLSSMSFLDNKALVTGYGGLLQCNKESIALIDLSDPLAPSVLFRGMGLDGSVTSVGAQLLTAVPFIVIAEKEGRSDRYLSVFNYEDTKTLCRGGQLTSVPQQRKVTVDAPNTRRTQMVAHQIPASTLPPPAATSPSAATGAGPQGASSVHHPVVFATEKRGALVREESTVSNVCPQRPSAVVPTRVESSGFYYGSFNNNNPHVSNAGRGYNEHNATNKYGDRNIPVQAGTSPEMMAMLTNFAKQLEDFKTLSATSRSSRLLLDDMSKLHSLVSRLAIGDQLGPAIDGAALNAIEQEYQSHEGRVIAAAVERLRLSSVGVAAERGESSSYPRRPGVSRSATNAVSGRASPSPRLDVDKLRDSVRGFSNSYSRVEDPVSMSGCELPPESLLRWVAQLTRSGQGERESHRRQLESLQRHNARIVERNTAFINGIARIEQALRTQAQRLLEEADATLVQPPEANWDASNSIYGDRHVQLLNQALQQVEQISVSSSPKEINEAIGGLITLNSRLLSAQQHLYCDVARKASRHGSVNALTSERESQGPAQYASGGNHRTRNSVDNMFAASHTHSPRPSQVSVVAMRPQRIMTMIGDEVAFVETFVKDVGKFWCCLGETQKVIYLPYEGGQKPDLFQDFMQYAVLWHLRRSQVMVDVCRRESIMVVAEALFSDFNDCQSDGEKSISESGNAAAHVLRGDRTWIASESTNCGGSRNGSVGGQFSVAEGAPRCSTAWMVSVSLELESVASRMRESFRDAQWTLPPSVPKETVGGFFLIPSEKLHVHSGRLRGLLYWSRLTMHLLFECLECLSGLVFHGDEQPRSFHKDNFKAMEQQVDDWRSFLQDLHNELTQLRSVVLLSQRENGSAQLSASATDGSDEQGGLSRSEEQSQSTDGVVPTGVERCMQWLILLGLYIQRAGKGDVVPPLFISQDSGNTMKAADFGLMAVLDEVAEDVEAVRAKTAALLRYCQKVQSRFARIIEEAVVNEEVGQVFIPLWRGGPIAERYCKGFCHDME
ncbi:hypothetical protein, conserved [Trypanosoma brucei brucei TREU927]|uniref:Uncharacterized protein n=1 Tax=Trypanosoma brucei brucei (strain 927/4 GUTat10.1) TaxID=185431 RepID=Q385Y9_TRYB2|nr:hypothetical protein, conserved [Trypanosoma brucei brucei TREU927]EAN79392.1 hypothetical protein, conserved [Trypanosoma brucei brucei TREU927]